MAEEEKDRRGKKVLTICAGLLLIYLASVGILFGTFRAKFETLKAEIESTAPSRPAQFDSQADYFFRRGAPEREEPPEPSEKGILHCANPDTPGEVIDLPDLIKKRKTNIVFFKSGHCPSCTAMVPLLEKLAAKRADFHITTVEIDRKDASEIDLGSPVAQQFDIHTVPKYMLYDYRGKFISTDDDAKQKVRVWIRQSDLQ